MSKYLVIYGKPRYLGIIEYDGQISKGDSAVVESHRGEELAVVAGELTREQETAYRQLRNASEHGDSATKNTEPVVTDLNFVSFASEDDIACAAEYRVEENEILKSAKELLKPHDLEMKLIDVEFLLNKRKLFFYFSSEQRVDFRAYVRDLAREFKTRIELRQIGVRDEAKIIRGVGPCGQPCCCSYWLNQFAPICIKMVKEQNLALNPAKISGICGRLMCCMCFEHNVYHEMWEGLPNPGTKIKTPNGNVIVAGIEIHLKNVRCFVPGRGEVRVPIKDFELFKDTVIAGGDWIVEEENKDAPLGDIRGIFPDFSSRSDALVPLSERAEIEVIPDKKNVAQEHNEYPVHDKSAKKKKRRPRKPNNGVEQQNVREHEGQEKEHKTVQEDPSAQGTQPKPHRPRHRRPRGQKKTAETKPK